MVGRVRLVWRPPGREAGWGWELDGGEDVFYFVVGDDGEDGVVEFRPGVGAAVGVAVFMSATLNIFPEGETTHFERVEEVLDTLVVGLVVYY